MPSHKSKTKTNIIKKTQRAKVQKNFKKIEKIGIDTDLINNILENNYSFHGAIAQDNLVSIKHIKTPFSIIVNTDTSNKPGKHWIAIYINKYRIEIFDSLGFNPNHWSKPPTYLIKFIQKYLYARRLTISKPIQFPFSNLCGLYCIYFILYRRYYTIRSSQNLFTDNYATNDQILYNVFNQ